MAATSACDEWRTASMPVRAAARTCVTMASAAAPASLASTASTSTRSSATASGGRPGPDDNELARSRLTRACSWDRLARNAELPAPVSSTSYSTSLALSTATVPSWRSTTLSSWVNARRSATT